MSSTSNSDELEMVPGVASAALRKLDNGELVFTISRALKIINACTMAEIAVLGVEVFPGLNVSTYDLDVKDQHSKAEWPRYVRASNALAAEFVKKNLASPDNECILTTASWREFLAIRSGSRHKN